MLLSRLAKGSARTRTASNRRFIRCRGGAEAAASAAQSKRALGSSVRQPDAAALSLPSRLFSSKPPWDDGAMVSGVVVCTGSVLIMSSFILTFIVISW